MDTTPLQPSQPTPPATETAATLTETDLSLVVSSFNTEWAHLTGKTGETPGVSREEVRAAHDTEFSGNHKHATLQQRGEQLARLYLNGRTAGLRGGAPSSEPTNQQNDGPSGSSQPTLDAPSASDALPAYAPAATTSDSLVTNFRRALWSVPDVLMNRLLGYEWFSVSDAAALRRSLHLKRGAPTVAMLELIETIENVPSDMATLSKQNSLTKQQLYSLSIRAQADPRHLTTVMAQSTLTPYDKWWEYLGIFQAAIKQIYPAISITNNKRGHAWLFAIGDAYKLDLNELHRLAAVLGEHDVPAFTPVNDPLISEAAMLIKHPGYLPPDLMPSSQTSSSLDGLSTLGGRSSETPPVADTTLTRDRDSVYGVAPTSPNELTLGQPQTPGTPAEPAPGNATDSRGAPVEPTTTDIPSADTTGSAQTGQPDPRDLVRRGAIKRKGRYKAGASGAGGGPSASRSTDTTNTSTAGPSNTRTDGASGGRASDDHWNSARNAAPAHPDATPQDTESTVVDLTTLSGTDVPISPDVDTTLLQPSADAGARAFVPEFTQALDSSSDQLADEWSTQRVQARPAYVVTEIYDPSVDPLTSSTEGQLAGTATQIAMAVRRIEARNGKWVRDISVTLPVAFGEGFTTQTDPENTDLANLKDDLNKALDTYINHQFLLPVSNDQLHITVDFVHQPDHQRAVTLTRSERPERSSQTAFHLHPHGPDGHLQSQDAHSLLHEILHYTGVTDRYPDTSTLFRAGNRNIHSTGLMAADTTPQSKAIPTVYLTQIETATTSGPPLYDHPYTPAPTDQETGEKNAPQPR
ncbi:hypothetical protein, partial [Streptomyces sp. AC627_RSS907]|uniref:hypothetical protein n=1 Tax=Streptomyces sp. AC627_RSS907 TaxID=2823684 RepID=UPI001C21B2CE